MGDLAPPNHQYHSTIFSAKKQYKHKKLDKRIQEKSLKHTKISTIYRKFEKSIIIYLVSKQTPVVSIPNKQHRSLRQEATAATL